MQQSPDPTPTPTTIDSSGDRYTGLDRFGRVVDQNWIIPTPTPTPTTVQRDQYGYDQDSNVLYDDIVGLGDTAASYSQLYHASSTTSGDNSNAYDPLNRETTFIRGTLGASGHNANTGAPRDTVTNISINTAAGSDQAQTLDALGNWSSSATGAGTGGDTAPTLTTTDRTNNSQNEITVDGVADLSSDNNGNTTYNGGNTFEYDAWNRPASLAGSCRLCPWATCPTRTWPFLRQACTGGGNATVSFYTTDMQVLQDDVVSSSDVSSITKTTAPQSQMVWGLAYQNQMVARDDNSTDASFGISGSGLGLRIYPLQDANWNVRTLTDNSGTVLGAASTIDVQYGNWTFLTSAYASGTNAYGWLYGFQGGRYDTSLGLYTFGVRQYGPVDREVDDAGWGVLGWE